MITLPISDYYKFLFAILALLSAPFIAGKPIDNALFQLHYTPIDAHSAQLKVDVLLPEHDFLYKDYLQLHIDNPAITLDEWKPSVKPISRYDNRFRDTKLIFTQPFSLTTTAHSTQLPPTKEVRLYISYYQNSKGTFDQKIITIPFNTQSESTLPTNEQKNSISATNTSEKTTPSSCLPVLEAHPKQSLHHYISTLFQTTHSTTMRLLLCFLLGLLLSLTPCIYPMIPITIGIMHTQRQSSLWHNFLLALAYSLGISSTFATLGLGAAITGSLFGNFMNHPLIVLLIVGFLLYLALSMMGFYEMYTPSFLQSNHSSVKKGSFVSAFVFGAASGTVASPCLSPGLALLLTFVATLHNYFLGFLLLFSFGMGLSMPLLLIGTFSKSLSLLPKAGQWMEEVKHFFGLIMIALCFYFLKNIMPHNLLVWSMIVSAILIGILELYNTTQAHGIWRKVHQAIGISVIALALISAFNTYYKPTSTCPVAQAKIAWVTNYQEALSAARTQKKLLFIYLTASYCTLCTSIERCVLSHPDVASQLTQCVPCKLDACDETDDMQRLRKTYAVIGVPTYLLIDPHNGTLLNRWGSELYNDGVASFVQSLTSYLR
jgi:thiol:disulfide interchange protein